MSSGTIDAPSGPVAAILDFEGADDADYRRLSERMHSACRHRRLQGCIYHWMKPYPDGFRVIEFWTGREPFEWFLDHEFRPMLRELGLVEPLLLIEAMPEDVMFDDEEPAATDGTC